MSKVANAASELIPHHERVRDQKLNQKAGDEIKDNSSKMIMGRYEDWLKLTMACIQNQDPMNPMDPTQMATQFAHFGQIIGVLEIKDMMQKVINAQGVTQVLEAASQLDRVVEVTSNTFHYQENDVPQLSYTLPNGTQKSLIVIYDDKMQIKKSLAGEVTPGKHFFTWDGEDFKGGKAEPGKYSFKVIAYDEASNVLTDQKSRKPVLVPTTVKGTITGGEFANNKPMLNMRGVSVPLDTLVGIHSMGERPKVLSDINAQILNLQESTELSKKIIEPTEKVLDLDGRIIQESINESM
ncbi:MAG: hypothetical protein K2X53_05885 [Alphaproteobacteria bacterium]|nr:hypothetical protein [Alphaproteobacteria bacterium]